MRERPILFSAPMVRAILAGEKTQTRRVVKPQPVHKGEGWYEWGYIHGAPKATSPKRAFWHADTWQQDCGGAPLEGYCPYGQPGDRLWVRETFTRLWFNQERDWQTFYRADDNLDYVLEAAAGLWKPSIHMSRAYSRISLEVTAVRVERVRDITEADAWAEGVHSIARRLPYSGDDLASVAFSGLWEEINGTKAPWASNPFVWCISFRRI